MHGETLKFAEL